MTSDGGPSARRPTSGRLSQANLSLRAARERRLAEEAGVDAAATYERLEATPTGSRLVAVHARLLFAQRRAEERHRVAAEFYDALASRRAASPADWPQALADGAAALASICVATGARGAVVRLPTGGTIGAVLASDARAAAAEAGESMLGEGPAFDCAVSGSLHVAEADLGSRWPFYGPVLAGMDIHSVSASTLRGGLGTLVLYDAAIGPPWSGASSTIDAAADILPGGGGTPRDRAMSLLPDATAFDHHPVVHQAAGVLHVRLGCAIDDAVALLRARAFAEGLPTEVVARAVLDGTTLLADT
ncbi:MAG: ANTAR domain-containing protein [Jatrophihabitans sp.]|uniref:ANTAR domain-containing protein n=1 Tax=Jatrophihabitans sp. TaxID=1932789 RepID=UPI003F7CDD81